MCVYIYIYIYTYPYAELWARSGMDLSILLLAICHRNGTPPLEGPQNTFLVSSISPWREAIRALPLFGKAGGPG